MIWTSDSLRKVLVLPLSLCLIVPFMILSPVCPQTCINLTGIPNDDRLAKAIGVWEESRPANRPRHSQHKLSQKSALLRFSLSHVRCYSSSFRIMGSEFNSTDTSDFYNIEINTIHILVCCAKYGGEFGQKSRISATRFLCIESSILTAFM